MLCDQVVLDDQLVYFFLRKPASHSTTYLPLFPCVVLSISGLVTSHLLLSLFSTCLYTILVRFLWVQIYLHVATFNEKDTMNLTERNRHIQGWAIGGRKGKVIKCKYLIIYSKLKRIILKRIMEMPKLKFFKYLVSI